MARRSKLLPIVALHAVEDERGHINVLLPEKVRQNRALMCRLHHRVVDLLAEKGMLDHFADDVEERLSSLSAKIVSDFIDKLLREGQQAPKRDKPSNGKGALAKLKHA